MTGRVGSVEHIYLSPPTFHEGLPIAFGWFILVLCLIYSASHHKRVSVCNCYFKSHMYVVTVLFNSNADIYRVSQIKR